MAVARGVLTQASTDEGDHDQRWPVHAAASAVVAVTADCSSMRHPSVQVPPCYAGIRELLLVPILKFAPRYATG